jgi:hypothetical protein
MAIDDRLLRFVDEALRRGVARPDIEVALSAAGWRPEAVREALGAFAESSLPLPVPRPSPYLSARETFLYLVLFTSLYLWTCFLGSLAFDLINNAFPDPAAGPYAGISDESLRWSVAWLVVSFPVFLGVSRGLARALRRDPTKRASRVRKWLTYLTLYVAATVVLGDVATLVYELLGGELTARFVLKVLTVALIAGGVFGYYLADLRAEEREGGA